MPYYSLKIIVAMVLKHKSQGTQQPCDCVRCVLWERRVSLRFDIRGVLRGAGQRARPQPLPGLLDLLQVPLHVRQLRHRLRLGGQLLRLLQQLPEALGVHSSGEETEPEKRLTGEGDPKGGWAEENTPHDTHHGLQGNITL